MRSFSSFDGCTIAYRDTGGGPTVVLLHGALVDTSLNWDLPGVTERLVRSGFRVVRADARGHGSSDRPHEPRAYAHDALARDVIALIDHLDVDAVAVVGYSMGADTAIRVASMDARVTALVAGGIGADIPRGYDPAEIAAAIRDESAGTPWSPLAAYLAELARSMGGDRLAYAALFESEVICPLDPPDYAAISLPVLIIAGTDDDMASGGAGSLAERFPSAVAIDLTGRDHLGAVFAPAFTDHVTAFLDRHHPR